MSSSIPKTMKAVQLMGFKEPFEVREIPVPEIHDNDVLIKIGAAGFCHTDYQVWQGVYESPCPIVPSHEPVGTVVAVGSTAQTKWKVGQRVGALLFRHQCHSCTNCQATNDIRFCENADYAGLKADGGMAEYMIGDADNMCLLPDSIPFEQAAPLMCAGATVYGAILRSGVPPSEPLGIIGIGGLGTLAVQLAKARGHRVVAIDNRPEGRELATAFDLKADLVVDQNDPEAKDKIKYWAGKNGLAGVIVCTDYVPVTKWGLSLLRPLGSYVPLGLPVASVEFNSFELIFQQYTIVGSVVSNKEQAAEMLSLVDKFNIRSHITTYPIEKAPDFPELYWQPHLKGRLVMKFE